jgi:ADP-heptose:LPS heptosyltransferase
MGNVYIFRIGHLGDTLLSLPAISEIRERHKNEDLVLITNKPRKDYYITAWDVLKHTDYFKDVLFYDLTNLKSLLKIVSQIRKSRESILYYLPSVRTKWQASRDYIFFKLICGANKIVGLKLSLDEEIKKDRLGNLIRVEKESDRLLKAVIKKDHPDSFLKLHFPLLHPAKDVYGRAEELLKEIPQNSLLLAIGHGAKMPANKWPIERYKDLCARLLNYDKRIYVMLLGGKEAFESGEFLRKGLEERILNAAGKTTIIESAAIVEKSFLFIGNDTGSIHLAASMGIPCVGIFSARCNPGKWEPYGEHNIILRKEVECAGCFLEECLDNEMKCIKMITVDEVSGIIIGFLNKSKAS